MRESGGWRAGGVLRGGAGVMWEGRGTGMEGNGRRERPGLEEKQGGATIGCQGGGGLDGGLEGANTRGGARGD